MKPEIQILFRQAKAAYDAGNISVCCQHITAAVEYYQSRYETVPSVFRLLASQAMLRDAEELLEAA
jgi:hypothetical protein